VSLSPPRDLARHIFARADTRQDLIEACSRVSESLSVGIRARFQQLIESAGRSLERL